MSNITTSNVNAVSNLLAAKQNFISSPKLMFQEIYQEKIGGLDSLALDESEVEGDLAAAWDEQSYYSQLLANLLGVSSPTATAGSSYYSGYFEGGTATDYEDIIQAACSYYNVSPALIKSVIKAESGFNPNAVSSAGAIGLMQLMPGTAAGLGVNDPYNPEQNIWGGVQYLADLIKNFDGDLTLALSGYNMGGNAVKNKGITPNTTNQPDYDVLPSSVLAYANKVISNMTNYQ